MKKISVNDLIRDVINDFDLSTRSTNALMKSNFETVGDLVERFHNEAISISRLGKKSENEINALIKEMKSQNGRFLLVNELGDIIDYNQHRKTFVGNDGCEYFDIEIDETVFTVRGKNSLERAGFKWVSDVVNLSYENLMDMRNMGKGTAEHIISVINSFDLSSFEKVNSSTVDAEVLALAKKVFDLTCVPVPYIIEVMQCRINEKPNCSSSELLDYVFMDSTIREKAKQEILDYLRVNVNGLNFGQFVEKWPVLSETKKTLNYLIKELEAANNIVVRDDVIEYNYPSILTAIDWMPDERMKRFMLKHLYGQTLEEIGVISNLTRERVRQIIEKGYKRLPRVKEDKYAYLIENYDISKEEFVFGFSEPEATYIYLKETRLKENRNNELSDRLPLTEAIEDNNISVEHRKCIQKIFDKDKFVFDGVRVPKTRKDIVDYLVKTRCEEKTHFDDFYKIYNDFVKIHGLDSERYEMNPRTYMNKLAESPLVLWNDGRSFRHYDIASKDYEHLYEVLDLEQYQNVVLSTYKMFKDYPILMKEYDIHDEYELHNLLKKTYRYIDGASVDFGRMPTIIFGSGNREKQIYDLMLETAPITTYALADLYEERYGEKSEVVMGNTMRYISQYNDHGTIRIDLEPFTLAESVRLKTALMEDIYSIEQVKQIYMQLFPNGNLGKINSFRVGSKSR